MKSAEYEVLIIGGGLVGASLACALGEQNLPTALIESVPIEAREQPGYDDRAIALAQGTQRIFNTMGLWKPLAPSVTPIHRIHVSDRGRFGFTRLDREEEGVEALGYVAPILELGRVLAERMNRLPAVKVICPAQLKGFSQEEQSVEAEVESPEGDLNLSARLLVAADGARSGIRDQLNIPVTRWQYGQSAVITNITPQLPHRNIAYERFTDTGPLAVLPMRDRRCAVVWTVEDRQVEFVMSLDDDEFIARLEDRFGSRLGRLEKVGTRQAFPLQMLRAKEAVRHRLALIGNAAHTLHPIAGQGFNLGIRDVATLTEVIVDAVRQGLDPGEIGVLNRYADWRRSDHLRVVAFTDAIARLFSWQLLPVTLLRDTGMVGLDLLSPAKRLFARLTMGRAGRMPRLSRGMKP